MSLTHELQSFNGSRAYLTRLGRKSGQGRTRVEGSGIDQVVEGCVTNLEWYLETPVEMPTISTVDYPDQVRQRWPASQLRLHRALLKIFHIFTTLRRCHRGVGLYYYLPLPIGPMHSLLGGPHRHFPSAVRFRGPYGNNCSSRSLLVHGSSSDCFLFFFINHIGLWSWPPLALETLPDHAHATILKIKIKIKF